MSLERKYVKHYLIACSAAAIFTNIFLQTIFNRTFGSRQQRRVYHLTATSNISHSNSCAAEHTNFVCDAHVSAPFSYCPCSTFTNFADFVENANGEVMLLMLLTLMYHARLLCVIFVFSRVKGKANENGFPGVNEKKNQKECTI